MTTALAAVTESSAADRIPEWRRVQILAEVTAAFAQPAKTVPPPRVRQPAKRVHRPRMEHNPVFIAKVRALIAEGVTGRDIAGRLGYSEQLVSRTCTWNDIPIARKNGRRGPRHLLTASDLVSSGV